MTKTATPLLAYRRDEANHPRKGMFAEPAFWTQVMFVGDRLAPYLTREPAADLTGRQNRVTVVGTHRSKSVDCPVYEIKTAWGRIQMRNNFHDWNVTVISDKPITLDASTLQFIHRDLGYCYFQGMTEKAEFYAPGCCSFSFSCTSHYDLYAFLRGLHFSLTSA